MDGHTIHNQKGRCCEVGQERGDGGRACHADLLHGSCILLDICVAAPSHRLHRDQDVPHRPPHPLSARRTS
eukprot:720390-Amphidinium_carterae.1